MATKRDQLHAHQFLAQRAVSALVTRETDPEQPPFRRPLGAAFGGVALAAVVLVGFGVWGLLSPGGNRAWAGGERVIIEKETGTRYVYLDGRLHPVANYSSALLALNRHAETQTVSRDSLAGVPRGPRIGIPGAPDALPGPDMVLGGGWTLCSEPTATPTGDTVQRTALLVGQEAAGGAPLGRDALVVEVQGSGERHLVHEGYRHRIADPATVGLALGAATVVRVAPAVVDVLPAGEPIAPIPVPKAGTASTAVPGHALEIGQLVVGGDRHYLVEATRLRPISALQYDIQRAYQPTAAAYDGEQPVAIPLELIALADAEVAAEPPAADADPPATRPTLAAPPRPTPTTCLTFTPSTGLPQVTLDPPLPPADPMTITPGRTVAGLPLADRLVVPPGSIAVVEAIPSPTAPAGTLTVVTDLGMAYPLADRAVLEILGYAATPPIRLPTPLVARVPQGPALSHPAAMGR
ncbi:type VII secretion protein EccB [Actinokineospora sp. UTMC 2448]|uniref:type VII secretion protein EccB n=1 Tax=Actinokineospora sp. UTMC 2448 TaxID=2268449 RepID=UPI0021648DAC|nr:type VII secretion protein EccB [Actinokineospora sp. UTMC 2448]UVS79622.1 Type VII secretion system protein eccB1 [Actinokineospora sp. UTMC 2448]